MKKVLVIILALVLILGLTSCGLSQTVKNQEKQALAIAQSIPLPPSYYSSKSGDKMMATKIKIEFNNYDTNTGEPEFSFSFRYIDPKHHPNIFQNNPVYSEYDLGYPLPADGKVGDSYYASSPNNWSWTSYQYSFTLSELQQYQSELVWK